MANYQITDSLAEAHALRVANAASIEQQIQASLGFIKLIMVSILPTDVVAEDDPANWARVVNPATGELLGLEARLYLTDGEYRAPISPWGYFKIVNGNEVHLMMGSDPLKVATLPDWARPTPLAGVTAAYEELLRLQAGGDE